MNRVLSIVILLLWSSIIRSQPVTEQEALEAVTSFLNTRDFHGTKLRDGRLNGRPHLSFSSSQLYAFDTGDRFILAGADRRLPSILGYSDHGTFNEAYTKSDCFRKMVLVEQADILCLTEVQPVVQLLQYDELGTLACQLTDLLRQPRHVVLAVGSVVLLYDTYLHIACKGTNKRGEYKAKNTFFAFILERKCLRDEVSKVRISEENTKQKTLFLLLFSSGSA